ncbi:hypothetical protein NEDG_01044 [Nematocida displodere]|uniref:SEP domain-containing protein n=1 Tax=Nematocida displodere TaxID=1805483 RepID=A0A177EAG4_9MICR|nr:hypothetical protein NEDG_01044 [Nematocida displodere]
MDRKEREPTIKGLIDELGCTENQAKNALTLAQGNVNTAKGIIREYRETTRTSSAGGTCAQMTENPKSEYAEEFERLQKHSDGNQNEEAAATRALIIYKNGFLIDEKFTPMTEAERNAAMKQISETGEVPSEMFGIKQGDLVDVDVSIQTDEVFKEDYPGPFYSVKHSAPAIPGDAIELGSGGPIFKLIIKGKSAIVKMGPEETFHALRDYLGRKGINGNLKHEKTDVSWDENPSKFERMVLQLE